MPKVIPVTNSNHFSKENTATAFFKPNSSPTCATKQTDQNSVDEKASLQDLKPIKLIYKLGTDVKLLKYALDNPSLMSKLSDMDILKIAACDTQACELLLNSEHCKAKPELTKNLKNMLENMVENERALMWYPSSK